MGSCPKLAKRALMTENPVMVQIQGLIRGAGRDVISLAQNITIICATASLWSMTMLCLYVRVQVNILGRHLYLEIARGSEGSHSFMESLKMKKCSDIVVLKHGVWQIKGIIQKKRIVEEITKTSLASSATKDIGKCKCHKQE